MCRRIGNFAVGGINDPTESCTGDAHLLGRLLLVEPVKVSQSQGLELIEGHNNLVQLNERAPKRLVNRSRQFPAIPRQQCDRGTSNYP